MAKKLLYVGETTLICPFVTNWRGTVSLFGRLRAHWFYPVFAAAVALSFALGRVEGLASPPLEAAILFLLVLLSPLAFFACYRRRLNRRQRVVGCLAASCSGLFIAGWAIPAPSQDILPHLWWARMAELVLIALLEIAILYRLLGLMFRGDPTAEQLSKASGAPAWVAWIMLLEANFWKAVWNALRRGSGAADRDG